MTGGLSYSHGKTANQLQSMGRGDDSLLAHITPGEAQMLLAMGGRGSRHPKTGLLEFGLGPGGAGATGGQTNDGGAGPGGMGAGDAGEAGGMGRGAGDHGVAGGGVSRGGYGDSPQSKGVETDNEDANYGELSGFGEFGGINATGASLGMTPAEAREASFGKPAVGSTGFANAVNLSQRMGVTNPVANGVVGALSKGLLAMTGGPLAALGIAATQGLAGTSIGGSLGQMAGAFGYEGEPNTNVSTADRTPGGFGGGVAGRDAPSQGGTGALSAVVAPTKPQADPGPVTPPSRTIYYNDPFTGRPLDGPYGSV